jgi:hypothetical protein
MCFATPENWPVLKIFEDHFLCGTTFFLIIRVSSCKRIGTARAMARTSFWQHGIHWYPMLSPNSKTRHYTGTPESAQPSTGLEDMSGVHREYDRVFFMAGGPKALEIWMAYVGSIGWIVGASKHAETHIPCQLIP